MNIVLKKAEEVEAMRVAGRLAAEVLDYITPYVKPGATTLELDRLCHAYMADELKVIPAPLHYAPVGYKPFPNAICTSVNDQVCHGIPNQRKLKEGDIVNVDITVIKDSWHGDTSRMFLVGEKVGELARRLSQVAWECLWMGIRQVKPGATLGDIGHAIQTHARANGFSVVREYCGHGIGRNFHEDPQVMHFGEPGTGEVLRPQMTFTIEPMINAGRPGVQTQSDGWTVVTKDRSWSAQWEHMVHVTDDGFDVLTFSKGAPSPPA